MSNHQIIEQALSDINLSREPHVLYAPITYTLECGGKRMRPLLVLTAADMFEGAKTNVIHAALALEVFHNFTLLHDDLMDNADTRRGRPTVHKKWNTCTAILSGDQMLIEAYKQIQQVPQKHLAACLTLFNQTATEICEGQQYDMEFETRNDVTLEQYIEMIRLKTAVLPAAALKIGALLAEAGEKEQQTLWNIGINIGLAFQLRDDYLDVYGDPATFGKAIGGDIIDKKKTFLYITAHQTATPEQHQQLKQWFDNTDNAAKIQNITRLYTETGADKQCLKHIEQYHSQATTLLDQLSVSEEAKQPLRDIIEKLMKREK